MSSTESRKLELKRIKDKRESKNTFEKEKRTALLIVGLWNLCGLDCSFGSPTKSYKKENCLLHIILEKVEFCFCVNDSFYQRDIYKEATEFVISKEYPERYFDESVQNYVLEKMREILELNGFKFILSKGKNNAEKKYPLKNIVGCKLNGIPFNVIDFTDPFNQFISEHLFIEKNFIELNCQTVFLFSQYYLQTYGDMITNVGQYYYVLFNTDIHFPTI